MKATMKKFKVTCPFCECSFEISESESVNCMCGGADEHYFNVKDLMTGDEYVEKEV